MWYRMECDVGDDELWEELGAAAGCCGATALGHYAAFTGRYVERVVRAKISGRLDQLLDATIEKWAHWRGPAGAFAAALRTLCTDPSSGELKGFREKNATILAKQLRDAQKRRPARELSGAVAGALRPSREPARVPPRVLGESQRANEDDDEYGAAASSSASVERADSAEPLSREAYEARCVAACNEGLRANQAVAPDFDELVAHGDGVSTAWFEEGVAIGVAEEAIYVRATRYRPTSTSPQPHSLRYLNAPVREAWTREMGRAVSRPPRLLLPPSSAPDGDAAKLDKWVARKTAEVESREVRDAR